MTSSPSAPPPAAAIGSSGTELPDWVNLTSSVGFPEDIVNPLMAYDPARDAIILTGGSICTGYANNGNGCVIAFLSNATWEFRGGHWSNISAEVGPAPKAVENGYYQGFMAYDSLDRYLVLWDDFGQTNGHAYLFYPQTWVLGASVWTNITSESPNQPGHSGWAVYDPVDAYVVYLDSIGDTWEFGGGVWTRLGNWSALNEANSTVAPAFQQVPEMAWDNATNQAVLFGGGSNLNQTWTFVGGKWSEVTTPGLLPPGNASIPLFFDDSLGGVVFYGGPFQANTTPTSAYTWVYSNQTWTNVSSEVGTAPPRPFFWGGSGAPDPEGGYFLVFVPILPLLWPNPYLWAFADRPVAVLAATPSTVETGGLVSFDGQALGGHGSISFQYSDLPPGCAVPTGLVFSCRPTGIGTFDVGLNVTDAEGFSGNATALVHVLSLVGLSVNMSPSVLDVGQYWNLSATASGGLPSYAYAYSNLPAGCVGVQATVTCRPTLAGVYSVGVVVTDSLGDQAVWNGTVIVNPDPTASLELAYTEVEMGETESVSWNVSGGTGPYNVTVSGLPPGCPSPAVSPVVCQPSATGTYPVNVNAVDSLGVSAHEVATVTVVAPLTLSRFSATPATVSEGTSLLLVTNLTGGIGPSSYTFLGLPPGCVSANTSVLGCTPTASGTWTVQVRATDSRGSAVAGELNLTVGASGGVSLTLVDWGLILGVVVLAAVGALVLVLRKRNRGPPARAAPAAPLDVDDRVRHDQRDEQDRDRVDHLDERVDGGTRGILGSVPDGVADDGGLVGI
jgi:hypothetical protein